MKKEIVCECELWIKAMCWRLLKQSGEIALKCFIRPADKNRWCLWCAEVLKTSCTLVLLSPWLFWTASRATGWFSCFSGKHRIAKAFYSCLQIMYFLSLFLLSCCKMAFEFLGRLIRTLGLCQDKPAGHQHLILKVDGKMLSQCLVQLFGIRLMACIFCWCVFCTYVAASVWGS